MLFAKRSHPEHIAHLQVTPTIHMSARLSNISQAFLSCLLHRLISRYLDGKNWAQDIVIQPISYAEYIYVQSLCRPV
jgi:hypothetical protein